MCYDYKGALASSQLVYGWNIHDVKMGASSKPLIVLTPPLKEGVNARSNTRWRLDFLRNERIPVVSASRMLSMCFWETTGIYCFTPDHLCI